MTDPIPAAPDQPRRDLTAWYWAPFALFLRGIKRLVITVVVVVIMWNVWCALDPPEPLRISAETTFLTEPIADDGLPDYAAALLEKMGRGTPPEQNGAVELWRILGPEPIPPEYRERFFDELGCEQPNAAEAIEPLTSGQTPSRVASWLTEKLGDDPDPELRTWQAEDLMSLARKRPLPAGGVPPLGDWVARNRQQLDLLVAAADKPAFYDPPPNLLGSPASERLVEMLLPGVQGVREPVGGLALRAAFAIDQGDYEAAWRDIDTVLALGERLTEGHLIVPQLVGVFFRRTSYESAHLLLDHCEDQKLIRQVLERLKALPNPRWTEQALTFGEPLALTDYLLSSLYKSRRNQELDLSAGRGTLEENIVLGELQKWHARIGTIVMEPDRLVRQEDFRRFDESIDQALIEDRLQPWSMVAAMFARDWRSQKIGEMHVALLLPASAVVIAAEDRSCARQRLTLLAAALKLYRLDYGEYPDSLDALMPALLDDLPVDPFTGEPFRYKRRGDGFLLYSLGLNGVDDGGSDIDGDLVDGEFTPIDWWGERDKPQGPDDLVVRLPIPTLELPERR